MSHDQTQPAEIAVDEAILALPHNQPGTDPVYRADVVRVARNLYSEHGENPEYDRAITEMAGDLLGYSADYREAIQASLAEGHEPYRHEFDGVLTSDPCPGQRICPDCRDVMRQAGALSLTAVPQELVKPGIQYNKQCFRFPTTVWVVGFTPTPDGPNSVGGHDWFLRQEDAAKRFVEHLTDGPGYIVATWEMQVPKGLLYEQLTEYIRENDDDLIAEARVKVNTDTLGEQQ